MAATAALGVVLVGCAPLAEPQSATPLPTVTPTVSPSSTKAPEPAADEKQTVQSLVIDAERFSLLDANGDVVDSFGYFEASADAAVAALTELLGASVQKPLDGGFHGPDGTIFDWSGLEIWDYEGASVYPHQKAFRLVVMTASVGDVAVSTSDGISVGSLASAAAAVSYRDWVDSTVNVHFYLVNQVVVDYPDLHPDYQPAAFHVGVWVSPADGIVSRIDAPSENWGA